MPGMMKTWSVLFLVIAIVYNAVHAAPTFEVMKDLDVEKVNFHWSSSC